MAVETDEGVAGIGMGNVFGVILPSTAEAIFVGVIIGVLLKDTVSLSLPSAVVILVGVITGVLFKYSASWTTPLFRV